MRLHRSTVSCCFAAVAFVVASSLTVAAAINAKHVVAGELASSGPEGMSGLCLWFKADSISGLKNGEIVTRWNDSGPKGIHLDKPSGTPTFVANALGGRPAVRFREGQTDGMQASAPVPTLAGNPEFTIHKTITAVYREERLELYVAPNGRDDWSGTLAQPNPASSDGPFATLGRARETIRQLKKKAGGQIAVPVRVYIRGGKYFLTEPVVLGPDDSGTRELPVVYMAYAGESPVFSGGRRVTGWQPYKGRILQCAVAGAGGGKWHFRQLFYNGKSQVRARIPNFDPQNPLKGGWATMEGPAEPGSQTVFKYKPQTFPRKWAKPQQAEVNLFIGYDWANNIIPVQAIDESKRVITLAHSTTRFTSPPSPLPFNLAR